MKCSVCNGDISEGQKFCRSCGAELNVGDGSSNGGFHGRRSQIVFLSFAFMFIGIAIGVVGKMILLNSVVTAAGVIVSLAGMLLTMYPFLSGRSSGRQSRLTSNTIDAVHPAEPTKKLNPLAAEVEVPSVAENTTTRLKIPR
jgi:hypothetical protein